MIDTLVGHPAYAMFIMFFVMPVTGWLIRDGWHITGLLLIMGQLPWAVLYLTPFKNYGEG
jgi:hypothetical protein